MSFSRAFSTRRNKPEMEISLPMFIGRAASQRGGRPVVRTQISSPVALVSTSNQHIHNAHNISGAAPIEVRHVSSGSTSSSGEDSDAGNSSIHSHDTHLTDASSVDNSPISPEPEYNHLTSYFKPGVDTIHSRSTSTITSPTTSNFSTPRLPARAPSHSKRAHEGVHRKRSIQRMLSPPPSRGSTTDNALRSSTEIFALPYSTLTSHPPSAPSSIPVEAPRESNPFGKELAQLDAVAEEFGVVVRSAERDADEVFMEAHGLARFSASEYRGDIWELQRQMFEEDDVPEFEFF